MFVNCLRNKFHVPTSKGHYLSPPDLTLRTFFAVFSVYILKVIVFPKVTFISKMQYRTLFYNFKLNVRTVAGIGGRLLMWLIRRTWVTSPMPVPSTPARACLECWVSLRRQLYDCC
jgi:hypothetical protein